MGKLLEILIDDLDFEWLMIDASHIKVHPQATGARGGNQAMAKTKRSCQPDQGIDAQALLADRGYDTDEIVAYALYANMEPVIPPKRNRIEQREYDRDRYKMRHLVENAFLALKRWSVGAALPHVMPRLWMPLLLLSMAAASPFGSIFYLNSCRHCLEKFRIYPDFARYWD